MHRGKFIRIEELSTIHSIANSNHCALVDKGKWRKGHCYEVLDLVVYYGRRYCCICAHEATRFRDDRCLWYSISSDTN